MKALKQQLESKELHLEMLQKKVSKLEEKSSSYTAWDTERQEVESRNRRLLKDVDRLKKQLAFQQGHIVEMKATSSDYENWKVCRYTLYST